MSFFNEEIDTAISLTTQQNHINMLLTIAKNDPPDGYETYLSLLINQEFIEYLDSYGGELDPKIEANQEYLKESKK